MAIYMTFNLHVHLLWLKRVIQSQVDRKNYLPKHILHCTKPHMQTIPTLVEFKMMKLIGFVIFPRYHWLLAQYP
jgi:hypothetical protein